MFRDTSMMMSSTSANRRNQYSLKGSSSPAVSTSPSSSSAFFYTNSHPQVTSSKTWTVSDFERKLQESDTYLQLIIEQVKQVDEKITQTSDAEIAACLVDIKAKTLTLLDGIKHSIALLQIAKNTVLPVNGILTASSSVSAATPLQSTSIRASSSTVNKTSRLTSDDERERNEGASSESSQNRTRQQQQLHQHDPDRQHLVSGLIHSQQQQLLHPHSTDPAKVNNNRRSISQPNESNANRDPHPSLQDTSSSRRKSVESLTSTAVSSVVKDSVVDGLGVRKTSTTTADIDADLTFTDGSDDEDDDCYYDAREPDTHSSLNQSASGAVSSSSRINTPADLMSHSVKSGLMDAVAVSPAQSVTGQQIRRGSSGGGRKSSLPKKAPLVSKASKDVSADGGIDFDALYEESDEEDLGSLEGHGSVISHLISQVKIGMDLTKVVLPTFILERRSLLEMYADFFAHPDLFVSIADQASAEGRFIQVVRWYLSAFHAGRKSSVAKKPYNPVMGETFKCHWKIPENQQHQSSHSNMNEDGSGHHQSSSIGSSSSSGPLLTFIAEQVSHHPPISAFYAESVEKRISCTAHIYTKSKFLGLSIGVHNIGQGVIRLLDREEDYIVTFPSAYGRSILTVPWIELGGGVTIDCPQTGLHANVEFLTKPFYGGKKNKIACEVFAPNKKQIMCITGEWNGVMMAKWPSGKTEIFVDTRTLPIIKKKVSPISQQEEYESRRLWKDLTYHLRMGNVSSATDTKCAIEQRQRDLAKERHEKGEKWQHRAFHDVGGNWFYNHPLTQHQQRQTVKP